jgi:hypothetical protein
MVDKEMGWLLALMALDKMRPARGFCLMRLIGIIGNLTIVSTQMNVGKQIIVMMKAEMMNG